MSVADGIRSDAKALLESGRARVVLGYRMHNGRRAPILLTNVADADALIYDAQCRQNLAAYLRKEEVRRFFPAAVVAGPAVMRSLVLLAAESQIAAEDVLVLAVGQTEYHGVMALPAVAELLKAKYRDGAPDETLAAKLKEIAAMTPEERAAFWTEQFEKCTRCYACRAACPGCYCQSCVAERNVPQWISTLAARHGNFAWNVIRAYHQAGRCTLCGACEEACPQGLPLMLLNAWIEQQVREEFDFKPGYDMAEKPLIGSWRPEDDDSFMR